MLLSAPFDVQKIALVHDLHRCSVQFAALSCRERHKLVRAAMPTYLMKFVLCDVSYMKPLLKDIKPERGGRQHAQYFRHRHEVRQWHRSSKIRAPPTPQSPLSGKALLVKA